MSGREILQINIESSNSLGDTVYEALREAIIKQVLKPGERLMETELAEEMGVSRTPVREAMRKLELEDYVEMIPRKGTYVSGLSIKDVNNLFEIRGALETLAAGLAAKRATQVEIAEMRKNLQEETHLFETSDVLKMIEFDTCFHEIIYSAARNVRLQNMIKDLRDQIQRFRTTSLAVPGRMKFALAEHHKIVEAIALGDVQEAERVTRAHLASAENALLDVISHRQ